MIYLNRLEVIGNLTRDPELRFTPNQQPVASFAVATNRRYRDNTTGNWIESPVEYHEIVVWGQLGERCNQMLHKGDRIFVSGRQQTHSWETPDGNKRYKTEMVADSVIGPDQINKGMNAGGAAAQDGQAGGMPDEPSTDAIAPTSDAPASTAKPAKKSAAKAADQPEDEINIEDIPF